MLEVYSLQEHQKWDEIVGSFSEHDIYYLSGYTRAFYLHGDGESLLFFYEDSNGRAINVVMKRDIGCDDSFAGKVEKNSCFDLTTPYGYGGWLIEGDVDLNKMMDEYENWCKKNSIVSEVIRFHPVLANQEKVRDIYDVMDLGKTVVMDLESEETIWNNITSKNRNVIRKAIKNNVTIHHGFNKELLDSFKEIYDQTMRRDEAAEYYYFDDSFYRSILEDLNGQAEIYYAVYDSRIIASSIILRCNGKLSYHLSGSLKEYGSLAAGNLLLYEVAKDGCNNGYKSFHLGGGVGSKEDRLYSFKKAFNRNEGHQYSIGKKIFDQETYDKLVEIRGNSITRENFFPLYRG